MRTSSSWVNYFLWKCERHIPTSKTYPAIIARCAACQYPRPDEAYRPSMFPDEPKPVVRVVSTPPPLEEVAPDPVLVWDDGPEPELDEEPCSEVQRGLDLLAKVISDDEPEVTPEIGKRPKDIPVTEKSKAHLCPGPKCRKLPRRNSPYCSKICSDRCLRLRKKASYAILTDEEITNLNRIVTVLDAWNGNKG